MIYHGGGLLVGSSEIIPQAQIDWLADHGFIVVIPNYRLAPQVTGATSLSDGVEAHDWAASGLADTLKPYSIQVNTSEIVAMGHSSGGTIALHAGSCRPVKAVPSILRYTCQTSQMMRTNPTTVHRSEMFQTTIPQRKTGNLLPPPTSRSRSLPFLFPTCLRRHAVDGKSTFVPKANG